MRKRKESSRASNRGSLSRNKTLQSRRVHIDLPFPAAETKGSAPWWIAIFAVPYPPTLFGERWRRPGFFPGSTTLNGVPRGTDYTNRWFIIVVRASFLNAITAAGPPSVNKKKRKSQGARLPWSILGFSPFTKTPREASRSVDISRENLFSFNLWLVRLDYIVSFFT